MNFNEVFRKNVTYDNINCHKAVGLHPFSGKTKEVRGVKFTPLPSLQLLN